MPSLEVKGNSGKRGLSRDPKKKQVQGKASGLVPNGRPKGSMEEFTISRTALIPGFKHPVSRIQFLFPGLWKL